MKNSPVGKNNDLEGFKWLDGVLGFGAWKNNNLEGFKWV